MKTLRQKGKYENSSQNPFIAGMPVWGSDFFNREDMINDVKKFICSSNQYNYLIFGQRRIGKTSFLRKLEKEICPDNNARAVYFNLQDKANVPLDQLLYELAKHIERTLDLGLNVAKGCFGKNKASDYFKYKFLPELAEKLSNAKPLVLLFDEFDVIGEAEYIQDRKITSTRAYEHFVPYLAMLLEHIKEEMLPIKFIFAVGRNYKDLKQERYGQINKFNEQNELKYFDKPTIRRLLQQSEHTIPFTEDAINRVFELTSGQPYFTQALAYKAYDNAEGTDKNKISMQIVDNIFPNTVKSFASGVFWIWETLFPAAQVILYLVAIIREEKTPVTEEKIRHKATNLHLGPAMPDFKKIISHLLNINFIKKIEGEEYAFTVEFLREWIISEINLEDIQKQVVDDEDIDFNMTNARYYFNKNDYAESLKFSESVLEIRPSHFEALYLAGKSCKQLGHPEKGYEFFKIAFSVNPIIVEQDYIELLEDLLKERLETGGNGEDIEIELCKVDKAKYFDRYALRKIEKSLKIQLKQLEKLNWNSVGYILDDENKITGLGLYDCSLKDISGLKQFTNLAKLTLCRNQIIDIPPLNNLNNLTVLHLAYNQIVDISPLKNLKNLRFLRLSGNQITDISPLKDLKNLTDLYLYGNQIVDISPLKDLKNLMDLSLSSNQISDISGIEGLKNLESLWLYNNNISNITPIRKLEKLKGLSLQKNQIIDISALKNLECLKTLVLSENPIEELPLWITDFNMEIQWLDEIEDGYITFDNNPLKTPPPEIVRQGKEAVRNYFEQLAKSKKKHKKDFYLFESKLLIIGEPGAGKTTFARKIQNPKAKMPEQFETTQGIDIYKWDFEITQDNFPKLKGLKMNKTMFYLNLWDFGGQDIYHGTHQFFFSKNALYVLLADTRKQKTDFNYWLLTIEQLAGESPLLIVLNRREGHKWQIDETGYKSRYGEIIKEIRTVDLSDPKEIPQLQQSIKYWLQTLPQIGDKLPASWVNIREDLNKESGPFITFERYKEICKKHEISGPKDVKLLSRYYDDVGVITHFIDDPALEERVYLDSNWLVKTVYHILDDDNVKKQQGRLSKKQAEEIWKHNKLHDETNKLMQLMQRFGLLFKVKGKDEFIVPEHLPEKMPYEEWPHKGDILQFRYKFDNYMPKGLMSRLIVALHHHITDHTLVWHRGVNLACNGAKAEIVETYGGINRFDIRIAGKNQKELLIRIIERFDEILSHFKKLDHDKLVPCICHECKPEKGPHFFILNELERRLEKGRTEVECSKSFAMVNVLSLIDQVAVKERPSDETGTKRNPGRSKKMKRDKVFISYSHDDDKKWLKKIQKHLKVLEGEGVPVNLWDDTKIGPGMNWRDEIEKGLQTTKVAILLVSTNFLASDFITNHELPELLKAAEKEGTAILTLILEDCRFANHKKLSKFQTINGPKGPLSSLSRPEQNKVLVDMTNAIEKLMRGK